MCKKKLSVTPLFRRWFLLWQIWITIPIAQKRSDEKGFLEPFFDFGDREISSNRQEIGDCFFLCHNFWVLNVKESIHSNEGQPPWKFMGPRVKPYKIPWSIDVHTEEDLVKKLKSGFWLICRLLLNFSLFKFSFPI